MRQPNPLAIFSRLASVGEVFPFSILLSVDLLTPVTAATEIIMIVIGRRLWKL